MINSITLLGNLVRQAELRYTPSGKAVATFTLAVNDGWGDNQKTYYIDCVIWEKSAEILAERCDKGTQIAVEGKLTTRSYKNKEDKNVKVTEVLVKNFQIVGGKKSDSSQDPFKNEQNVTTGPNGEDLDLPF